VWEKKKEVEEIKAFLGQGAEFAGKLILTDPSALTENLKEIFSARDRWLSGRARQSRRISRSRAFTSAVTWKAASMSMRK